MLVFYLSIIAESKNKKDFIRLYNEYRGYMFSIANHILNDPHESENIVHDSFIRILCNMDKFPLDDPRKTKGLICMIVSGLAKNEYNKRKRFDLFDDMPESDHDYIAVDDHVIGQEQYEILKATIKSMNAIYSDTLILKFYYHYSNKEIAEIMDVSEETVRQRLHRAKQRLRKLLASEGVI